VGAGDGPGQHRRQLRHLRSHLRQRPHAGQEVNPSSLILRGHAAGISGRRTQLIHQGLPRTLADGIATYDLARLLPGSREVACSEFGQALIDHM
jgi:isocitrate dehydrogenase